MVSGSTCFGCLCDQFGQAPNTRPYTGPARNGLEINHGLAGRRALLKLEALRLETVQRSVRLGTR